MPHINNPSLNNLRYTKTLEQEQLPRWKQLFAQAPYRWLLKRLHLGFTLEIGCGIGRNLVHLKDSAVGIDNNVYSVQAAKSRGLTAFTPNEFSSSPLNVPQRFDSILLSHVAEHMTQSEAAQLINKYVYLLKRGGKLIIITPQEAGFRRDRTHVEFMDFTKIRKVAHDCGLSVLKEYSFPFPRIFGRFFAYNEFVSLSCRIR